MILFAFVILAYFTCRAMIALITILRARLLAKLSSNIVHDLRVSVFEHIHAMSVSFTNDHKVGDLISRVSNDTNRVKNFIQSEGTECINQFLTLLAVAIYLFFINWKMALIVIVPAPLIVLLMRAFHRKTRKIYRRLWRLSGKCSAVLQDILSGIRVVKTFGTEEKEIERYKAVCSSYKNLCIGNEVFWNTIQPLIRILTTFSHLALMLAGGMYILRGRMDAGTLVQFTTYASMIYGPINYMISLPRSIADAVAAAARVFDILDNEPKVRDAEQPKEPELRGRIEYRDVYFGYKSYQGVLENISFTVKSGEMIGLVGHSGSGKSTMINLLLRFYDPDSGQILIDGVDLREIPQHYLRSRIGVVLQETFLFSGSIFENVIYSKPDATREEVIRACKLANAHDFIMKMDDAYDTWIGTGGKGLSGGERQRISLARAILKDPKILILDEATSAVDTRTELHIQKALEQLSHGRTTFNIAHRLSTLRNADRLIVIENGNLVEMGTHAEIYALEGVYYRLYQIQKEALKMRGLEEK